MWCDDPLPGWIKDRRLHLILEAEADDGVTEPINLDRTAGPAVLWGFSTLLGLTYFLAALPVVGTYIARCPAQPRSNEFANYPELILWIIFFAPLTMIVLAAQWKVMTYVCAPMVQQIHRNAGTSQDNPDEKPWVVFGQRMSFGWWFAVSSLMTVFNLLDQMTNALFTAKTWATRHCYGYQFIQNVWEETVMQSKALSWLQYIPYIGTMDFAWLTATFYFLQLFIQPIVALAYSFPIKWKYGLPVPSPFEVSYLTVMERGPECIAKYKTFSDIKSDDEDLTTHSAAAAILAEVNRMEAVAMQDMDYRKARTQHLDQEEAEEIQLLGDEPDPEEVKRLKHQKLDTHLEIALAVIGRGIARFCLKGLLQNAIQVNLQVSMAAISKTVLKGGIDQFNLFTIFITAISMLGDIPDFLVVYNFASKAVDRVSQEPEEDLEENLKTKSATLRFRILRLQIYVVIYAGFAILAILKMFFAVVVCPNGTWNLTHFENWGCTDPPPYLNITACPVAEYMCQ